MADTTDATQEPQDGIKNETSAVGKSEASAKPKTTRTRTRKPKATEDKVTAAKNDATEPAPAATLTKDPLEKLTLRHKADKPTAEKETLKAEKTPAAPQNEGKNQTFNNFMKQKVTVALTCGIAVIALVIGLAFGGLIKGGVSGSATGTSIAEDKLDAAIASYNVGGKTETMTARDVLNATTTLESAKKDDGTYTTPSADAILSAVRNKILAAKADAEGISVSDDDINNYLNKAFGTTDLEQIASTYNTDADTVKNLITQTVKIDLLRTKIVGQTAQGEAPQPPTTPENGDTKATSQEYATYIFNLAGDEWDSDKQEWKSTDGRYAQALASYEITNESASYEAAQAAYYVAYSDYSAQSSDQNTKWTSYTDDILANSVITIYTIGV